MKRAPPTEDLRGDLTKKARVESPFVRSGDQGSSPDEQRWYQAWIFPNDAKLWDLFQQKLPDAPKVVDLAIRKQVARHFLDIIFVRASGWGEPSQVATKDLIESILSEMWGPLTGKSQANYDLRQQTPKSEEAWRRSEFYGDAKAVKKTGFQELKLDSDGKFQNVAPREAPPTQPTLEAAVADVAIAGATAAAVIPNFDGRVYSKRDAFYTQSTTQYANQYASWDRQPEHTSMTPFLVAYPNNENDVIAAVAFAKSLDPPKKIVARSGGHQYCGMSSGGDDTILLSMDNFKTCVEAGGKVTAGVCNPLKDFSKFLVQRNLCVPHGECPLVNIGGHVQTGGFGHQTCSFGLCLDYIISFQMVIHDAHKPTPYLQHFTHPKKSPKAADPHPNNDEIFAAVLGGGPGSWGVVTEYGFEPIKDDDYKGSYGYSWNWPLTPFFSSPFPAALDVCRQLTEGSIKDGSAPDVDWFVTAIDQDIFGDLRPAAILVETMCKNSKDHVWIENALENVKKSTWGPHISTLNGQTPVSQIAHAGVRKMGVLGMTKLGREFDMPYKKTVHCTFKALTKKFVEEFSSLVEDVMSSYGVKVVFQGGPCGGEFLAKKYQYNTAQRRDIKFVCVFDVFFKSEKYKPKAEEFVARMKKLLGEFSDGEDVRLFWGSFNDPDKDDLDMNNSQVIKYYYDGSQKYQHLQEVKQKVDPYNIFTTKFCVQPPKK